MRAILLATTLAFLAFLAPSVSAAAEKALDIADRAVNSTPMLGPEGILLAPAGDIYVGIHSGKIMRVRPDGHVEEFADLNTVPEKVRKPISAIGIAMDAEGDIYAAAYDFYGGSVLKVTGPGKPESGAVSIYRYGIGLANFILIDDQSETMYVSNSSMFSGGVFKVDMKDDTKVGTAIEAEELLGEFPYANGLALGPERKWLYVAETTRGQVSRINLETGESEPFAKVGGWTDGLAFDPAHERLFVCDNRGGRIVAVDLDGNVVGAVRLMGKEGQCAPASLAFRNSETIVFTDLWKASLWRALLRRPRRHSYIYELPVNEIVE